MITGLFTAVPFTASAATLSEGTDYTLDSNGVLTIKEGTYADPSFNISAENRKSVTKIEAEDNVVFTGSCFYLFEGFVSCTEIDLHNIDTSNVTNMSNMFRECTSLPTLNLSEFDTSSATLMYNMFLGCNNITFLDLSKFNTLNVTDMQNMFRDCGSLTTINLSSFVTSSLKSTGGMFSGCSSLALLDLSSFNMSKVTYKTNMFFGSDLLQELVLPAGFDVTSDLNLNNGENNYGWVKESDPATVVSGGGTYAEFTADEAATYIWRARVYKYAHFNWAANYQSAQAVLVCDEDGYTTTADATVTLEKQDADIVNDETFVYKASYTLNDVEYTDESEPITGEIALVNRALTPESDDEVYTDNPSLGSLYKGLRLLGVQKHNDGKSIRYITVMSKDIISRLGNDLEDYGYVFAPFDTSAGYTAANVRNNMNKIKIDKDWVKSYSCKETINTLTGDYGDPAEDTPY
ncbi:MAG: BspA family leucine-rich repeat surface protein, partial [Ruminococcus sp.]|nr:BspA family leucine-rich repeat surface protein [Ruminococcus sp.]